MRLVALTETGHTRPDNQDDYRACLQGDTAAWAVVCDGMGGAAGGATASCLAVTLAQQRCTALEAAARTPQQDLQTAALLVREANARVYQAARQDPQLQGMGTTMVAALVSQGVCSLAWVGDSRAYLYRDGTLRQLTHDHSMVQEMVEKGLLSADEAQGHPSRNVITRAVGVSETVEPETAQLPLAAGDRLLLCTDGLTNALSLPQMEEILAGAPFYESAKCLLEQVLCKDEQDNATAVLLEIS